VARHELHFPIGAPDRKAIARKVRVTAARHEADGVLGLTLEDANGRPLPRWSAGAHVELCIGDYDRKYSLCGRPDGAYDLAILREDAGRGGSKYIHDTVRAGMELKLRGPHNLFRLDEGAPAYLLVAGGIGITPILTMADRLKALGKPYAIHYAGARRAGMALIDRLQADHGDALHLYPKDEGLRADLAALVAALPEGGQVYACGPDRMISALEGLTADRPEGTLHVEHFATDLGTLDPSKEQAFEVELRDSGLTLTVPADQTLFDTIAAAGIDVACDCREGLCGSCEVEVLEGAVDHRDRVLSKGERAEGRRMMSCCSRARDGGKLVLAL
jgi:ferredoxin-NADP reductase